MGLLALPCRESFNEVLCCLNPAVPDEFLGCVTPSPEDGGACEIDHHILVSDLFLPGAFLSGISLSIRDALQLSRVALDTASQHRDLVSLLREFPSEGGAYKTCSAGDKDFHDGLLTVSC